MMQSKPHRCKGTWLVHGSLLITEEKAFFNSHKKIKPKGRLGISWCKTSEAVRNQIYQCIGRNHSEKKRGSVGMLAFWKVMQLFARSVLWCNPELLPASDTPSFLYCCFIQKSDMVWTLTFWVFSHSDITNLLWDLYEDALLYRWIDDFIIPCNDFIVTLIWFKLF